MTNTYEGWYLCTHCDKEIDTHNDIFTQKTDDKSETYYYECKDCMD